MDKKALILIVDDNGGYRELLAWILELHGFQTISAKGGREAVALAIERQPQLVLMDLNMPGMNGYEATKAIHTHRRGRKIPVIAVSADYVDLGSSAWAGTGFIAFLAKPFEQEALLEIMKGVLANGVERVRAA